MAYLKGYEDAIESGKLAGVAIQAASKDGSFSYNKALGVRSLKDGPKKPFDLDTVCWLASCTKPMTSVCAMQCVERGLLKLDGDIRDVIPEYGTYGVITGWDEEKDEAITEPLKGTATLRNLLTHTSGQGYDQATPQLIKWRMSRGETAGQGASIVEKNAHPLMFQPGTGWMYGGGLDWVGLMIERVTGQTLEQCMDEHIWKPLGMTAMSFFPRQRPDLVDRVADLAVLGEDGKAVDFPEFDPVSGATACMGGAGAYGSPRDLFKFVHAVFKEDPVLLKAETYAELFSPQLNQACRKSFNELLNTEGPWQGALNHNVTPSVDRDFALFGMQCSEDQEGYMRKGTTTWGGFPCIVWWMDRQAGIAGVAASQMTPPMAAPIMSLHERFQREMYKEYAKVQKA